MSRRFDHEQWGPSHQEYEYKPVPFKRRHPILAWVVIPLFTVFFGIPFAIAFLETVSGAFGFGGGIRNAFSFLTIVIVMFVIGRYVLLGGLSLVTRPRRLPANKPPPLRTPLGRTQPGRTDASATGANHPGGEQPKGVSPAERARQGSTRLGNGAYLGTDPDGMWVTADPESAVLVLGPPRSGKTSAVMIPALMACASAALSTSTKPDVMNATLAARSEIGQAWLFDPAGTETDNDLPDGVRRLCWSPIAAASTWDEALVMARAMTSATRPGAGTTNENHWTERASALLAPLLYAANQTGQPISGVLRWTLRQDLTPALSILKDADSPVAIDVLVGIERTDQRERSSIFSATAGVLAAYNSDAVRTAATNPNFNPAQFATSTDTIYITAPEHKQALCAPLIVGLLEQIRHAVYDQARKRVQAGTPIHSGPPMLWLLDELANTAPIHDLPALISQAGGQGLQVIAGLQDLAQARSRWGDAQADALLSLFQTKLILSGISDARTIESISLSLGEYDREIVNQSIGKTEPQEWLSTPTHSDTVSYQTQRQRVLTPGEISKLPPGHGLLLTNAKWALLRLTPWHTSEPWKRIGADAGSTSVFP
jgi:type IV secretion system protein VirD4